MAHVDLASVAYDLPDGGCLLHDVSFRIGDGAKVALLGANGAGKTTLLRLVAGELEPTDGAIARSGEIGVMRQFVAREEPGRSVREFLGALAPAAVARAAATLAAAERALGDAADERASIAYADALATYGTAGGWEAEVRWDVACRAALGVPFEQLATRELATLSGGEQKRLALESLLRGPAELLLLDEPDNYLDVAGKRWLEQELAATPKTVLFVSHDRELVARVAQRIVTVEAGTAWTHGSSFASYHEARRDRIARFEELRRRWDDEHRRLRQLVQTLRQQAALSDVMASRYRAAQTRLRKFEAAGPPPEPPREQRIAMRLPGARTGDRVLTCDGLELDGLTEPFDLELFYGERVAVVGANGTGKSHLLRLLAGEPVDHHGAWRLGARVVPGHFAQLHDRRDLAGRTPLEILTARGLDRTAAMGTLSRYRLARQAERPYEVLSGGQQARVQILLLESGGATLLLLDEPT
ncbi:MAG TPA: ATP-binding cassette domain-containing protein, partial [Conexibacter sp.]|nr:ATP-binding cassette domain-containing protein [Conexibacter sp.]